MSFSIKHTIFISVLLFNINVYATVQQHNLRVDGITCPFCVATSAKALKKIAGVHKVDVDIKQGIIFVCADDDSQLNDENLTQLFLDKGFTYRSKETQAECKI